MQVLLIGVAWLRFSLYVRIHRFISHPENDVHEDMHLKRVYVTI